MRRGRRSGRSFATASAATAGPNARADGRAGSPVYRHISSSWFKPKSITRLDDRADELAKRYVDRMAELGGECDFVTDVAVHYPLYMILSLLGLPEEDFPRMRKLTQELFGTSIPSSARGTDLMATLLDFFDYFQKLTEDRRAHPTEDLGSADRERRDRREADRHAGGSGLLRPHRNRGSRHDELGDRGRAARADRASRTSSSG